MLQRLLVSPKRMGVPVERELDAGRFTDAQARFLGYHRDSDRFH
jgi:hypothetical protein